MVKGADVGIVLTFAHGSVAMVVLSCSGAITIAAFTLLVSDGVFFFSLVIMFGVCFFGFGQTLNISNNSTHTTTVDETFQI